jgi:hypothetical protein
LGICFFGELDVFTGSVPHERVALPELVADLRVLLLLHDRVVLPPGNLIEHPLSLPAFGALAPFSRGGLLGTSGDVGTTPMGVILGRTEKTLQRGKRAWRAQTWRRLALEQVALAWDDLLPETFAVVRDVGAITEAYATSIARQLDALSDTPTATAAERLLIALDRARQSGRGDTDRTALLARAAGFRGEVDPLGLHRAVSLVQGAYFLQGASSHLKWAPGLPAARLELYPGPFARRHAQLATQVPGVEPLPLGRRNCDESRAFLAALGLHERLFRSAAVDDLRALVDEPVWHRIRSLFEAEALPADLSRESVRLLTGVDSLERALARLAPVLGVGTLVDARGLPFRNPLQTAVQATLGVLPPESVPPPKALVFDLAAGTLDGASLSPAEARLLAALHAAGDWGLSVPDVMQMQADLAAIAGTDELPRAPELPTQLGPALHARRAAADQARHRLSQRLGPIGAAVVVHHGRWRLQSLREIRVVGTAWTPPPDGRDALPPAPSALKGQLRDLWNALEAAYPEGVTLGALAVCLGRAPDDAGRVYATKKVSALRAKLSGGDVAVGGSHSGMVRLVRVSGPTAKD